MTIKELMNLIKLPNEMQNYVINFIENNDLNKYTSLVDELISEEASIKTFEKIDVLNNDERKIISLVIYLLASLKSYEIYKEKGISEKIFIDTMKCFTRFLNESKVKYGKYIFDRAWWTYRQTSLKLFRIEELEYEFVEENHEKYISIHIPSDVDFRSHLVDYSLKEARIFINKYYPEYRDLKYVCDSWLLSKKLPLVLKEGSNILSFQKRFDIISEGDDKEYINWLFNVDKDTPIENLKEETSLQKNVKELIKKGINLGSARGILR